jgi:glycosyltransferase involved in cell wall biosynthesis
VLITVDPYLPVPPRYYGGIERVVDLLVQGLRRRGHRVVLVAHPDSTTDAELIGYGVPPHQGSGRRRRELLQLMTAVLRRAGAADVIHSFGRLLGLLPVLPWRGLPKIQSYGRAIENWRRIGVAAALAGPSLCFTACSASVFRQRGAVGPLAGEWVRIYNGVALDAYQAVARVPADAPLVFLGRLERIKGVHSAVAIARGAGRRLVIAGNRVADPTDPRYFEEEVAPHLDEDRVRYVGPVDDAGKNRLLGNAAALLMPIEWEEPFGIVMAEAFACGTPVIAFARGSVPEVVCDGLNGYVVSDVAGAVERVAQLARLDRRAVRADCEERFDAERITDQYVQLYERVRARCGS